MEIEIELDLADIQTKCAHDCEFCKFERELIVKDYKRLNKVHGEVLGLIQQGFFDNLPPLKKNATIGLFSAVQEVEYGD